VFRESEIAAQRRKGRNCLFGTTGFDILTSVEFHAAAFWVMMTYCHHCHTTDHHIKAIKLQYLLLRRRWSWRNHDKQVQKSRFRYVTLNWCLCSLVWRH